MLQNDPNTTNGAGSPPRTGHCSIDALTDGALNAWFEAPPRSDVPSAWYGHVPFAFWLVAALRPNVVVELGTQDGVAYCTFCEAVAAGGIDAKCYAVGTWQGDDGADLAPATVFKDLQAFHDPRYASFSRLVRTTSDEAATHFADGSVDLLHLNACRTYEAVQHDFETWRPKLSPRAVVLLDNINVRESDFGVWRLWSQLAIQYPSFEFVHEHGLGVLGVGPDLDGPVRDLCHLTDAAVITALRLRFAASGARARMAAEQERLALGIDLAERRAQAAEAARSGAEASKQSLIASHEVELSAAQQDSERLDLIAVAQELRAAEIRERLARTEQLLAETQQRLSAASDELVHKDVQIAHFRSFAEEYHALIGSTLWRALGPVRSIGAAIPPGVRHLLRRGGKAAWWLATPWRLSDRLGRRRERIALANAPPSQPVLVPPAPPPPADRFSLDLITRPRIGFVPLIKWYDPIAPEVSIVVLNWNGGDMTLLCLQHLWQHTTGHRYEIIVVDNGSDPSDLQLLRKQEPLLKLIALGTNRYFGEANNIGVEAARGRFICLLNNDAFVSPGWLEPLVRVFDRERNVGAVAPLFVYPDGSLQEAGALINSDGTVTQLGKGEAIDDPSFRISRIVDYVSAACLLMRRADFLRVLGFDLAWEPAYYEDVDLCLKLKLLGLNSIYCPDTAIVHVENATSTKIGASLRLHDIVPMNRAKFLGRWGRYLETNGAEYPALFLDRPLALTPTQPREARMRVLIYTPYQLTPGGGERYLLTIAESFKDVASVALVTPQPISRARLLTMGREFALDLDQVELLAPSDLESREAFDLAFILGNEIFPTIGRLGLHNVFICQFPFDFETEASSEIQRPFWYDLELVLTYSDYVRGYAIRAAELWNVPFRPVEVLTPPVPMVTRVAPKQRGKILHVGRFFTAGHCKRQDKLIDALRLLLEQGVEAELHLAGSTMPDPPHRAYYASLIEQAEGLPVTFHANCSTEQLHQLYAESDIYWHATGVGADVKANPHVVEHFGISVVEAMSARCIPIVFAAGGPATIVEDGVTGYHYLTVPELVAKTRVVLEASSPESYDAMRNAAAAAAQAFDEATFRRRVCAIAERLVGVRLTAAPTT